MNEEFISFGKIENIKKMHMTITQKMHGTNAQIYIYEKDGVLNIKAGSRSRWITPEDDNYGFAQFVEDNKQQLIESLGVGRHFGEWCGPGINSGEGLKEKRLYLFNWERWKYSLLPSRVEVIPLLHTGDFNMQDIETVFNNLKTYGSKAVEGYMHPEGIVIDINGKFYKKVFLQEDSAWQRNNAVRIIREKLDVSHLLQPLRLEKLLSRDERYLRNYPVSLKDICSDYVKDLEAEGQITGDEDMLKAVKKSLGGELFAFVKQHVMGVMAG